MSKNKVKFGLKNVHYAKLTETTNPSTGETTYSYGTVKPWPGAVNMSLEKQGDNSPFYADDTEYYNVAPVPSYSGDFESAKLPETVAVDVFGDAYDSNGVLVENTSGHVNPIALMFEFDGDVKATRHVLYKVTITRPSIGSATKTDSTEVQTETSTFTAVKRGDGLIHSSADPDVSSAIYDAWYSDVYEPVNP
jgi:phi13 family phage major tail protein